MTPTEKAALVAALNPLKTAATALAAAVDNFNSVLANAVVSDPGTGTGGTGGTGGSTTLGKVNLNLSVSSVAKVGDNLPVVANITNNTGAALLITQCVVAVRQPGASHAAGPFDQDVAGSSGSLAVGASRSIKGTFTPSKVGNYTVYITYQDAGGWHDGPDTTVAVSDAGGGTGGGSTGGSGGNTGTGGSGGTGGTGGSGSTGGSGGSTGGAGSGTFVNPAPGSGAFLGSQGWFISECKGVYSGNVSAPWTQAFIDALKPYKVFRFMDWNCTNGSAAKSWSARRQQADAGGFTAANWDGNENSTTPGVAYEHQIALCNAAQVDYWVCVPAQVDDDYAAQLAKLVASKLNKNLRVYLEYSNETWSGQFSAAKYVNAQGAAVGLPGSNEYYKGGAFTLYRMLQLAKIFTENGVAAPQLVPVFAASGNLDIANEAAKQIGLSSKYNSGMKVGLAATAPYIENIDSLSSFKSQVDSRMKDPVGGILGVAKTLGCASGLYEFGPGAYNNGSAFRKAAWSYDATLYLYQQVGKLVNGPICNYTLVGTWGSTAWGHYDHIGQSLSEAHGARAAIDWANGKK